MDFHYISFGRKRHIFIYFRYISFGRKKRQHFSLFHNEKCHDPKKNTIYANNIRKEKEIMIALMLEMIQPLILYVAFLDTHWETSSTSAIDTVTRCSSGIKCHF
jgi:hypothetical protein